MIKKVVCIIIILVVISCSFFKTTQTQTVIARVNNNYLYQEDIEALTKNITNKEDSIQLVTNYINTWATQQLLVDGAKQNLNQQKQNNFNKLVTQYKSDLYSKAYLEALVTRDLDTVVTIQEAKHYYNTHIEAFKLNEELVQFRYVNVDENHQNFETLKTRFKRYNKEDKTYLDSISIQFKNYNLNDSIWIKADQILSKIPIITLHNKEQLLKKSNFIQRKDSIDLYLVFVKNVLPRNQIAPLEYVKPTIDQIVINKRKLDKIKKIEKDITKDAIKNNQFEIY